MSLDYMTLAWRTELAAGPRLVLLALSDNANDAGNCYPSIQALADKCGLSVRSVRSHVADMEMLGLLERNERAGRSTYYQINLQALREAVFKCLSARTEISEFDRGIMRACAPDELFAPAPTPANSAAPSDVTPANSAAHPGKFCRPPRQILPGTPANSAAITIKEPSINRKGNQKNSALACPSDVPQQVWDDFLSIRKAKKSPLTSTALEGIRAEAVKAGMTLEGALAMCCIRGWAGFKASWVDNATPQSRTPQARNSGRHSGFASMNYTAGINDDGSFD